MHLYKSYRHISCHMIFTTYLLRKKPSCKYAYGTFLPMFKSFFQATPRQCLDLCMHSRLPWVKQIKKSRIQGNSYGSRWATKKTLTTFHYTVCLIGILIMVYYNAYKTGEYNALYTPTNHVFFHCSGDELVLETLRGSLRHPRSIWIVHWFRGTWKLYT